MTALLALAFLGALAPAVPVLAMDAAVAAGDDCCSAPLQQICQQSSSFATDHLQTAPLVGVVVEAAWRERILPLPEKAAAPTAPLAHADPPAYLRFHRFLL